MTHTDDHPSEGIELEHQRGGRPALLRGHQLHHHDRTGRIDAKDVAENRSHVRKVSRVVTEARRRGSLQR
jgi:hypothetical protein